MITMIIVDKKSIEIRDYWVTLAAGEYDVNLMFIKNPRKIQI